VREPDIRWSGERKKVASLAAAPHEPGERPRARRAASASGR